MRSEITSTAWMIWFAIMAGQFAVGLYAWIRRHRVLAIYLGAELLIALSLFGVARFGSISTYTHAFMIGQFLDYVAEVFLLVAIFRGVRKTGIPSKNHPSLIGIFAAALFAVAIVTLPFSLLQITDPDWKWIYAVDHVFSYWLCLMLVVAPFYAWLVDSAQDNRLLLTYIGFSLYIVVHAGVLDLVISSHMAKAASLVHIPDIAYLISLSLWFCSCRYQFAAHHWDPAQTAALKASLRAKRSHINSLSRIERVRKP